MLFLYMSIVSLHTIESYFLTFLALILTVTVTVKVTVKPEMLMLFDENGRQVFQPGRFRLTAGGCSPGERGLALGAAEPVSVEFEIL